MNLLVTGSFDWKQDEFNTLVQMGHSISFLQYEKEKLPCDPSWVDGIIGNGIFLSHPIEKFTNLKYIQLTSAGFDRVPMEYIKAHNIKLHNARGVYSVPMAEYAVCGVLYLYKQFKGFDKLKKEHKWQKCRSLIELFGKTVCIIGCGSVGTECAKRFKAFGCTVIGVDADDTIRDSCFDCVLNVNDIDCYLPQSDVVVLALPQNEATYHLFDETRLSLMKPGSVLINLSRGSLVDTDSLLQTVAEKRIMGAVLDVFETEPLPADSKLWNLENIIITPHNSFVGDGNHDRMKNVIFENIKNYSLD